MTDLILVIASLGTGGAERVLSDLANYWDSRGHRVTVVTIDATGRDFFRLAPGVRRVGLGLLAPSKTIITRFTSNIKRIRELRAVLRGLRPALVVSFVDVTNITTLIAAKGLKIPVAVSERSNPFLHRIGPIWSLMRALVYRWASALVIPVPAYLDWAVKLLPLSKLHVIPNAVRVGTLARTVSMGHAGYRVLAVGRLGPEKGFDLLLRAFAIAVVGRDQWSLTVVGDGPQRTVLQSLSSRLGLSERVSFPGLVRDVDHYYQQSEIFVLSSRYEGFPNVLLEAMAMGSAVISFDCVSGPSDLIDNGVNGLLVVPENVEALAAAMGGLMDSADSRRRLGARAREVADDFSPTKIFQLWDDLLESVSPNHSDGLEDAQL